MMLQTFSLWAALTLSMIGATLLIRTLIVRSQTRKRQQQDVLARHQLYEVGSPEHHAQIAGMVRNLNEHLAQRGKRLPEKTTIAIINQSLGFPADHRVNDSSCRCVVCAAYWERH